jgi:O-succinylbenzoate synthase
MTPDDINDWLAARLTEALEAKADPEAESEYRIQQAEGIKAALEGLGDGFEADLCFGGPGELYGTLSVPMPRMVAINVGILEDKD